MDDPARKNPLENEEIARLMSGADIQYSTRRTPGLSRLSGGETLAVLVFLAVVGTILYVHLDIRPFLPFQISDDTTFWLSGLAFAGMAIGWFGLLFIIVTVVWGLAQARLFPKKPKITCDDCGHRNLASHYVEHRKCAKCGGKLVYCGKCGLPSSIDDFLTGTGCTHCGYKSVAVRY
ncbi:MAG: hypothetical protein H6658_11705 [Ardenticatenaceae bacterium]|nr:hypothetical protein [Ardenticatenaceae bacterium]